MELENYNYSNIQRSGKLMSHVDALSRCYPSAAKIIAALNPAEVEDRLLVAQSRDPKINALRTRLEVTQVPGFMMRDGLVFRVTAQHPCPRKWRRTLFD